MCVSVRERSFESQSVCVPVLTTPFTATCSVLGQKASCQVGYSSHVSPLSLHRLSVRRQTTVIDTSTLTHSLTLSRLYFPVCECHSNQHQLNYWVNPCCNTHKSTCKCACTRTYKHTQWKGGEARGKKCKGIMRLGVWWILCGSLLIPSVKQKQLEMETIIRLIFDARVDGS